MANFFKNKNCDICKARASFFRVMKNNTYMLCKKKECDLISKMRAGFFDGERKKDEEK